MPGPPVYDEMDGITDVSATVEVRGSDGDSVVGVEGAPSEASD